MRGLRGFFLVAAIAASSGCAQPQRSYAPVSQKPALPMPASYQPSAELAALPVSAIIRNPAEGLLKIQLAGGARGEFESIPDFESRASSIFTGKFSFVVPLTSSSIKFDAYTGGIDISRSFDDAYGFGYRPNGNSISAYRSFYPSVTVGEIVTPNGTFEGQNAYGAKVLVERRKIDRVFLVFEHSIHGNPSAPSGISGRLNVSGADLQANKDNLALVYDVTFESPYLLTSSAYGEPTIHNPYQNIVTNYFLRANVISYRLINTATGREYPSDLRLERNYRW